MKPNVGKVDRTIRYIAGIAIIAWGISTHNWLGLIGILPLISATLRWCPAYCPLGISTDGGSGPSCCAK